MGTNRERKAYIQRKRKKVAKETEFKTDNYSGTRNMIDKRENKGKVFCTLLTIN